MNQAPFVFFFVSGLSIYNNILELEILGRCKGKNASSIYLLRLEFLGTATMNRVKFIIRAVSVAALLMTPVEMSNLTTVTTITNTATVSLSLIPGQATIGDRTFPATAASVWSSLPESVQSSPSLQVFRSRLKTELFAWSYSHD